MPENNAGSFVEVLKYGWTLLIGVVWWMWNRMVGDVDELRGELKEQKESISDHIMDDLKSHEDFVSHEYLNSEIKPWLNRIDKKMDTLVTQTADVIKREEYKKDIGALYSQLGDLKTQVARIEGCK